MFREEWINPLQDFIKMESEFVNPQPLSISFPDPDNKMFLEFAFSGKAAWLITGNIKHYSEKPLIVTPAKFM